MAELSTREEKTPAPTRFVANLWPIYVFQFCLNMHFIGGVLVPFFTQWGRISLVQVMLLQSWFMLWIFILEVPTGTIADRYGRKKSVLLGTTALLAAVIVYTSVPNIAAFAVGEFLWAISGALISGAENALVYDTLKAAGRDAESKRVFGRIGMASQLALLVAAPVGSLIATCLGLRETMLLMVVPAAVALLAMLAVKEPADGRNGNRVKYRAILFNGVKNFARSKPLKRLAANMIGVGIVAYGIIWLYQVKLSAICVPIEYFGIMHASIVAAEILSIAVFRRLEKALGSKRRLLVLTTAVLGGSYLVLAVANDVVLVVIAILLAGGFGLSRFTLFNSYFNKHIPSDERATTLSAISMFRTIAQAAFNPLLGALTDWSLPCTFAILAAASLVIAAFPIAKEGDLVD
ncbi:MAG: MFS transporter [Candidatus Lokiarchaeota archaeon]|nr:MFS transporter [Candidatus Lokiarchaeota archaeon]